MAIRDALRVSAGRLGRHRRLHRRLLRGQARHDALRRVHRRGDPVRVLPHAAGQHDRRPVGRLAGPALPQRPRVAAAAPAPAAGVAAAHHLPPGARQPNGYADTRRFLALARPPLHVDSLWSTAAGTTSPRGTASCPGRSAGCPRTSAPRCDRSPGAARRAVVRRRGRQAPQNRLARSSAAAMTPWPAAFGWSPSPASSAVGLRPRRP